MGNADLAQDFLIGMADLIEVEMGKLVTLRAVTYGDIDTDNPGAARTETIVDAPVNCFFFDFDEMYMPGSSVVEGGTIAVISLNGLTETTVNNIKVGNYIIENTDVYSITNTRVIEVAGTDILRIIQLKGD
jgi:hypothetical protein